jgi:hypothetical protein
MIELRTVKIMVWIRRPHFHRVKTDEKRSHNHETLQKNTVKKIPDSLPSLLSRTNPAN